MIKIGEHTALAKISSKWALPLTSGVSESAHVPDR